VDLRPGSSTDLEALVATGAVARSAADRLSRGSVGCALSHQQIYQAIIDEDLPLALVIEDDAVLAPNLAELLADPAPFLFDDRVTMLFYAHHGREEFLVSTQDSVPLADGAAVLLPLDGKINSTVGYVVTQGAARRLLDVNSPVEFPADGWDQYLHRKALSRMQLVHPSPVGHRDELPSTRLSTTAAVSGKAKLKRWIRPGTSPLMAWWWKRRAARMRRTSRTPVLVDRPSPFRAPGAQGSQPD